MEELPRLQLAALARVSELFTEVDIAYWLFGGWAVDFYAGQVTRAHDDLDIAVWLEDVPRIDALLEHEGWSHAPEVDEDGGTAYVRQDVRLELTYLVRDGSGRPSTPLRDRLAPWAEDALADDVCTLERVTARVIALPALVHGKSSPRDDPDDAAKDVFDFRTLTGC